MNRHRCLLGATPSKLCWADKASILFEPEWFYLLRARASGELAEYRDKAAWRVRIEESDGKWFQWLKRDLAKAALAKARCPFLDRKEETEIGGYNA